MYLKNIYCQCVLSQEATRKCALPKQGNKARKKTVDGNEEVEVQHIQKVNGIPRMMIRLFRNTVVYQDQGATSSDWNKRKQNVPGTCL